MQLPRSVCAAHPQMSHMRNASERRGSCREMETFSCTFIVTTLVFYFSFILSLFLLSCLLSALLFFPLPPCSTCLSELGRARCTHRTGEGPCLLSINNLLEFRNTSRSCLWQAVPHSRGRAFRHTRRNPYLLLAFSLTVSPGLTVWSPPQWLITPLQTTSAALCVRTY